MVGYIDVNDVEIRASLGLVKDYYKENVDFSVEPPANYDLLLDMFENDTVLTTAIDTTVDVGTSSGFTLYGKNKRSIESVTTMFEDTLDFDRVIQNIFYSMLIYGDAFMEIRWMDGKPDELFCLETTEMKIMYDEHGTILGYVQTPVGSTKKIYFKPDEVVHFKLKEIGSRVYSYTPFKSIMREYSTKKYASNYLSRIFVNFPPRLLYVLKTASKDQTKAFIQNLKQAKAQPHKDLVGWGEIEVKETGVFDFSKGLTDILNYLRTELLMITKVPPIWVGIPDDSNRSNSEAQIRSFETRIRAIQKKIESSVNRQLIPALGLSKIKLRFNPFSLMEEKSIIEIAEKMRTIGIDGDSVLSYIRGKGLVLPDGAKIEDPVVNTPAGEQPNRGADSGSGRKTKLDGNGVSEAGKKKRESTQVRTSITPDPKWELGTVELKNE